MLHNRRTMRRKKAVPRSRCEQHREGQFMKLKTRKTTGYLFSTASEVKAGLSVEADGARSTDNRECKHESAIRGRESVSTPTGGSGEIDSALQFGLLRDDWALVDTADRVEGRQETMKPALEGLVA